MSVQRDTGPVRLLHVIGESRYGGIVRIILGLSRVAQAEGWQVDVLTTDPVIQKVVTQHGLGLVNLDVIRREIRPLWDLGGLFRLRQFLRREAYHIVHTHTSKGGFVGRLAARLAGTPVIVHTAHGFAFHEGSPSTSRLFYSALERVASNWCDRIVSVSEFHRDWAIQLGICASRTIMAIPNGVAEAARNHRVGSMELRSQLGAQPGQLLILSISRLAADKGLNDLIEATALLPPTARHIHVVIAGDGPASDQLKRLANTLAVTDRVTFTGFREDVGDLLGACDLVILPSLREGLSMSLLEAMAAGKPIIATSIGSQKEVASHGEMALLVPPANPPALRNAILRLAGDLSLMTRLGANARAVYESSYTESRMLHAYSELYVELLRAKCPLAASPAASAEEHSHTRADMGTEGVTASIVTLQDHGQTHIIRRATTEDLNTIVAIHQKAFSDFFLTQLGDDFLRKYYGLVLNYHAGIILVSEGRRRVLDGFACGFLDAPAFYQMLWSTRLQFMAPVLSALLRQPSLVTRVMYGLQRIHSKAADWPQRSCELSSIAVAPEMAGNGFGKGLIQAFLAHAQSMDARWVYLTTDADGNNAANAFYRDAGFQHTRRFLRHKGRWMNEYVIGSLEDTREWHTY
jgi:glycosyltransferase involved in cell wall biosynthesis/ribosomal protein S18 acetylase RimI-like enzyme